jgi:hypothetical protein
MSSQINTQTTFAGIDTAKLSPILQEYKIPQVTIDQILNNPSLFLVTDVIKDPGALKKLADILPPKEGNGLPLTETNVSAFEKLFEMVIALQSDMSKLQAMINRLSATANYQSLQTTKDGNEKIADAERANAIAQVVSGAVTAGFSGMTMYVSFNGGKLPSFRPFSKAGVNAQSSPRSLSEAGMQALNSTGGALGGIGTGIAGIVAADYSKDGKNKIADADFQKTSAQALSEAVSNLRSQIDSQGAAAQVITSLIQSVSRN